MAGEKKQDGSTIEAVSGIHQTVGRDHFISMDRIPCIRSTVSTD